MDRNPNPYLIFPQEVWEMIMEGVISSNSPYLQPLFGAFPQLGRDFQQQRQLWLFANVLPLVSKYLVSSPQSVKECRLVCKTWCQAVDNYLCNHPSHRSYAVNRLTRRTVPYGEINFIDDPDLDTLLINTVDRMEEIQRRKENRMFRTPFNGRPVSIDKAHYDSYSGEEFLDAALNFLEIFGSDILTLYFNIPLIMQKKIPDGSSKEEVFTRVMKKVLQCLLTLKNVRRLTIEIQLRSLMPSSGDIVNHGLAPLLPQLPHLESFEVISQASPPGVAIDLVEHFKNQLLTLKAASNTLMYCIRTTVSNIVELGICMNYNANTERTGYDWNEILLSKLPNVRKLKVSCDEFRYFQEEVSINKLLNFIKPLRHQLEELYLFGWIFSEYELQSTNALPEFIKLKYLKMNDWYSQKYDILLEFPSLEHLALVKVPSNLEEYHYKSLPLKIEDSLSLEKKLKYYMYSPIIPGKADIFTQFSMLKLITIHKLGDDLMLSQFAREMNNVRINLTD